jgi:hypothetical protein
MIQSLSFLKGLGFIEFLSNQPKGHFAESANQKKDRISIKKTD